MTNCAPRWRKPAPSAHQKQIRFLTGLSMFIWFMVIAAFFWYFTRSSPMNRWTNPAQAAAQ
jgi:hypothetical protein